MEGPILSPDQGPLVSARCGQRLVSFLPSPLGLACEALNMGWLKQPLVSETKGLRLWHQLWLFNSSQDLTKGPLQKRKRPKKHQGPSVQGKIIGSGRNTNLMA